MKKRNVIALALLTCCFALPSCGKTTGLSLSKTPVTEETTPEEVKNIKRIKATLEGTFKEGDVVKKSDIKVELIYTDKTTKQIYNWTSLQFTDSDEFVLNYTGYFEFYIEYQKNYTTAVIYIEERQLQSITAVCNKTFKQDEFINRNDIIVTANYESDYSKEVTDWTSSEFGNFNNYKLTSSGQIPIHISFGGKSTILYVTVVSPTLLDLIVSTPKTSYYVGETIDKNQILVQGKYDNNNTITINTSDWSSSAFQYSNIYTFSYSGTHTFTITYGGISKTITFNVVAPTLVSITAVCNKTFTVNDYLYKSDISVTGYYNVGDPSTLSTSQWSCTEMTSSYIKLTTAGDFTYHISANSGTGIETTVIIHVVEPTLTRIYATCSKSFRSGDTISKDDIAVYAYYSNSTNRQLLSTEWSGDLFGTETTYKFTSSGNYSIVITHLTKTYTITVKANVPLVDRIEAVYNGASLVKNDSINKSDIIVTAHYKDTSFKNVSSTLWSSAEFGSATTYQCTEAKTYTIHISYTENSVTVDTTVDIVVAAPNFLRIEATCAKTNYLLNETINKSSIVVTAYYDNGDEVPLGTDDWESTCFDGTDTYTLSTEGEIAIPITYGPTGTTSLTVNVKQLIIDRIEATCTKSYEIGESISKSDITVTAYYTNNDPIVIPAANWTSTDFNSSGKYTFTDTSSVTFTISYSGKTTTVTKAATEPAITSIKVVYFKGEFLQNEYFSTGDTVVSGYMKDGTSKNVTEYCTFNPADGTSLTSTGTKTIYVTYTDPDTSKTLSTSYTIKIYANTWRGDPGELRLEGNTNPTFYVGDTFNDGGIQFWHYTSYGGGTQITNVGLSNGYGLTLSLPYGHKFTKDEIGTRTVYAKYIQYEGVCENQYSINVVA